MSDKVQPQISIMAKELLARMDKELPPKMTPEEHDKAVQQMWEDICDEADKRAATPHTHPHTQDGSKASDGFLVTHKSSW